MVALRSRLAYQQLVKLITLIASLKHRKKDSVTAMQIIPLVVYLDGR